MNEYYMQRCLDLASLSLGKASSNPMVGAVIVYDGRIIGEGYYQNYGGPHAEVNAIRSVLPEDRHLLKKATMYVSLEPCSFYGKTPPCADLLIKEQIPKVVIGCIDPHPRVTGSGIQKLKTAGIEVLTGVLAEKGEWLNRRFNTYMRKKRPYVILKWAQTKNGFFAPKSGKQQWISNALTKRWVHRWRTEEDAILVGTNTALMDNPQLTARLYKGNQALRLVIDRKLRLPKELHLFDGSVPTIVFCEQRQKEENSKSEIRNPKSEIRNLKSEIRNPKSEIRNPKSEIRNPKSEIRNPKSEIRNPKSKNQEPRTKNYELKTIRFEENIIPQILDDLYAREIQSVIVEGGVQLLNSFMACGLWDEIRVLEGNVYWEDGMKAPALHGAKLITENELGADWVRIYGKI